MSYDYSSKQATNTVRFADKEGNPLANTQVRVKMTNHEFLFGCNCFDTLAWVAPHPKFADKADFFKDRVDKFVDIFNYGTMDFYWGNFEPVEGEPRTESRMKATEYLISRGLKVKGHPLCWHTVCAPWLLEYDNKTILNKQLARIDRDVTAFKGKVDIWDVINEVCIMPEFDKYDNAITRICKEYGREPLVKEVFAQAKASNPDATLLINDFNLSEQYAELIERLLNMGVQIDAIGLQTHQHQGYRGKEFFEMVMDRFSRFNLPLHFTENTIISGHAMPPEIEDLNDYQVSEWPSTPEDEEKQKEILLEIYKTVFANPNTAGLSNWDFADGAWLGAPSGIIRKDNSLKPSYIELRKLIKEEWWTDITVVTDENGCATFTGYRGDYELSANGSTAAYVLKNCDEIKTVTL